MVNPIIVDDSPNMSDTDLLAAYRQTDGMGRTAEALRPEIERRNMPVYLKPYGGRCRSP